MGREEVPHQRGGVIFPFAQIADAFAYLEQGHAKGKVIVQMVEQ